MRYAVQLNVRIEEAHLTAGRRQEHAGGLRPTAFIRVALVLFQEEADPPVTASRRRVRQSRGRGWPGPACWEELAEWRCLLLHCRRFPPVETASFSERV